MKKKFLTLMLTGAVVFSGVLACNAVFALDVEPQKSAEELRFDREQMRLKVANKIAEDLKLTAEQQRRAEEIRQQGRQEIEPLMKQMKELREKMDEKRRANMEEFEKILTPEQKAKFEELLQGEK